MRTTLQVVPTTECNKYLQGIVQLPKTNAQYFCTMSPSSRGAGNGDSGGPFYSTDYGALIGVVSLGTDSSQNPRMNLITVMVRVGNPAVWDWIHAAT